MTDAMLAALTFGFVFGFGCGLAYAFRGNLLWRIERLLPGQCPLCKRWVARKNMTFANHRTAGQVYICDDCYSDHFHPFSDNQS